MARLQKNAGNANQFLVNDLGNLVKIKQPDFIEVNILYHIILANIVKYHAVCRTYK